MLQSEARQQGAGSLPAAAVADQIHEPCAFVLQNGSVCTAR